MTTALEKRYRLLVAGFLDGPRAPTWSERLGADLREAVDLLAYVLANDLALPPPEIDREQLTSVMTTLLPARLSGTEPYRTEIVDLLEDLLLHVAEAEGLTTQWEWVSAIDAARGRFDQRLADPDRPVLARARHEPHRRPAPKVGRNDPCPCGSGRKYKVCCLRLPGG